MKTTLCLLLLLLPAALFPQEEEADLPRHGISANFQGSSLDQLGYRYRISASNSLALSLQVNLYEYGSQSRLFGERNSRHADLTVIYEHSVYRTNAARCFLALGLGYRIHTHENTDSRSVFVGGAYSHTEYYVNHNYRHTYKGVAGVGGEFLVTKNLSVFIHQYIELISIRNTDRSVVEVLESTTTELNIADVALGMTIYF